MKSKDSILKNTKRCSELWKSRIKQKEYELEVENLVVIRIIITKNTVGEPK